MKKLLVIGALCLLLCGCDGVEEFETMQDVYAPDSFPEVKSIQISLPEEAATSAIMGNSGTMYFCDGYEIALETVRSGDVASTVQMLTGYDIKDLTVIKTGMPGMDRYESAWIAAGETGDMVGRLAICDDGAYHYCLCVTASAQEAGSLYETWGELFSSFDAA